MTRQADQMSQYVHNGITRDFIIMRRGMAGTRKMS